MNILFEPFSRWAAAQCKAVAMGNTFNATISFADNVTLLLRPWKTHFWWMVTNSGVVYLVQTERIQDLIAANKRAERQIFGENR